MTIEDYMQLPKERLAELLASMESIEEYYKTEPGTYSVVISPCHVFGGYCTNPDNKCTNCPKNK